MHPRHCQILQLVETHQKASVALLAEQTGVSQVTIRQDLSALEQQGYLRRIHGGAEALVQESLNDRLNVHFDTKLRLAVRASELVEDGESILIEGGSANALLARQLNSRAVTVITPNCAIAQHLREGRAQVILLGGNYQSQSDSLVGPLTLLGIEQLHFSKAFIGIDGCHPSTGFTNKDLLRADVVRAILAKGQRNILLTNSSKFGQIYPANLGAVEQFDTLITDRGIPDRDRQWLEQQQLKMLLV
ncbi:DeoR/GlpR family DNA-binding transcription regulator [Dongshaea marina]|uniref:DeoR/GlpR family DNA-binding transcription regulator n=1 Tax=Dongshaea marina TaxID=2047966 RepID=UPI000D3E47C6|nr:DNA-binding transcriptional regulator YciT [Dongshaea marina]